MAAMPSDPDPERPPPRFAVHVNLAAISRDLQELKDAVSRRPARGEVLRLALGCLAAVVIALILIR
jgi:hypothetical protein